MSSYIPYTEAEKEKARQTDIADMLMRQGETLRRSGSELEWRDGSAKVTIRGNLWFHQYDRTGGDAIDFVRRFYNKSYPEAMEFLLGGCGGTLTVSPPVERKPTKPFELPKRSDNMRRVYAYLLSRSFGSLMRGFQKREHHQREISFELFLRLLRNCRPGSCLDSIQSFHRFDRSIGYNLFYFHVLYSFNGYKDSAR